MLEIFHSNFQTFKTPSSAYSPYTVSWRKLWQIVLFLSLEVIIDSLEVIIRAVIIMMQEYWVKTFHVMRSVSFSLKM